jgi:amino-acid N-acetyltransferase
MLDEEGLPTADIDTTIECLFLASLDGEFVGIGGIEPSPPDGLLRSLVIRRSVRGQGHGEALCEALEAEARKQGIDTLYLLTTTAAEFFAKLGYTEIGRATVPETIRSTAQFADLCPDTAVCLKKSL